MTDFVTLSVAPSYPLSPDGEIEDVLIRSENTAGYRQTRPRFTRARRTWGVSYDHMGATDVGNLKTFEQVTLVNGAAEFNWTHPVSGTFVVQLKGPIKYNLNDYGGHQVSFELEEV